VTDTQGVELESSYESDLPLRFAVDSGRVLCGLNDAVKALEPGESITLIVPAIEAHGEYDAGKQRAFRKTTFYQGLKVGQTVTFQGDLGNPVQARVLREEGDSFILDMNHPLAGQDLSLELELLEILKDPQIEPFI
jgi:peptidylprolyl isomerase